MPLFFGPLSRRRRTFSTGLKHLCICVTRKLARGTVNF
jgi:hypothetical protein